MCQGTCQGVIALNMEDGTLHRFRAASTILATGVHACCASIFNSKYAMTSLSFIYSPFRAMVGPTFLRPLLIHAQETAMRWFHVLGFLSRFVLLLIYLEVSSLDLFFVFP